jgi:hypothetical protein
MDLIQVRANKFYMDYARGFQIVGRAPGGGRFCSSGEGHNFFVREAYLL